MSGDVNAAAETINNYLDSWVNFGHADAKRAVDALVAEVERLQAERDEAVGAFHEFQARLNALEASREQLRAERDAAVIDRKIAQSALDVHKRLRDEVLRELDKLRVEKQQLEERYQFTYRSFIEAKTNVQRLQEALRQIAAETHAYRNIPTNSALTARAALSTCDEA